MLEMFKQLEREGQLTQFPGANKEDKMKVLRHLLEILRMSESAAVIKVSELWCVVMVFVWCGVVWCGVMMFVVALCVVVLCSGVRYQVFKREESLEDTSLSCCVPVPPSAHSK